MEETRLKRLERTLAVVVALWLLTIGVLLSSLGRPVSAQAAPSATDVLRVHQLVIVDEKGVERVVVGPITDARINGKSVKRRSPATGVQVNDAAGNERAGVAVLDDGSAVVGIDHEHGQVRAHLYWLPNKGSGLVLQGDRPKEKMALSIPRAQAQSSGPTVEVWNETGRPVYPTLMLRQ